MRTRAERRHYTNRVKNKFKKYIKTWEGPMYEEDWLDWYIVRKFNNRTPCSCMMCGNPRRKFKEITLQEKTNKIIEEDIIAGMEKE